MCVYIWQGRQKHKTTDKYRHQCPSNNKRRNLFYILVILAMIRSLFSRTIRKDRTDVMFGLKRVYEKRVVRYVRRFTPEVFKLEIPLVDCTDYIGYYWCFLSYTRVILAWIWSCFSIHRRARTFLAPFYCFCVPENIICFSFSNELVVVGLSSCAFWMRRMRRVASLLPRNVNYCAVRVFYVMVIMKLLIIIIAF